MFPISCSRTDLIKHAVKNRIIVSLGHHLAKSKDIQNAAKAGAKALTHLENGIPNLLPRHLNPIWDGLAKEKLTAMIITDGHYLPVSVIKSIVRAKGVLETIIVSDVSPIGGLAPEQYKTLDNDVILDESGYLA